jgi:predicted nucleic acid-binding protein
MRWQRDGGFRRFLLWNSSLAHGTTETSAKLMRLSAYVIVPLRSSTGTRAYQLLKQYAKSHGLHVFDWLAAATAIEEGLTLVTKNSAHRRLYAHVDRFRIADRKLVRDTNSELTWPLRPA